MKKIAFENNQVIIEQHKHGCSASFKRGIYSFIIAETIIEIMKSETLDDDTKLYCVDSIIEEIEQVSYGRGQDSMIGGSSW